MLDECHVSIPKRVSEVLKRLCPTLGLNVKIVSIPKRVSEVLKPLFVVCTTRITAFQSLKGFQRF